jgi:uncharacterized protein
MPFILLALASGGIIGSVLSLVGGGGSILAVPLLVYVVGVASPHVAIGTAAIAVALNAGVGLIGHWRAGTVKARCAGVFSLAAVAGAALGAEAGKAMDGQRLLALFGALMVVIGAVMLRRRGAGERPDVRLTRASAGHLVPRLLPTGLGVGALAGFFGIGGGFLIVPGLIAATGMPMRNAVGTSLVAVTALGMTTALSYAASGLVDWRLAALLVTGGIAGAALGIAAGKALSARKHLLQSGFAVIVIAVGAYVIVRGM